LASAIGRYLPNLAEPFANRGPVIGAHPAHIRTTVRKMAAMYKILSVILGNGKLIMLAFLGLLFPYIEM
jgi:hypothetical protein